MRLKDPIEIFYLYFMLRWENSAPSDRKQGFLDGKPFINSQISRMVFLLIKIGIGAVDKTFGTLSVHTTRNDGESYISKNKHWMKSPNELSDGWYFEGGTSLIQKQEILQQLRKIGLSQTFVECADTFVAGRSVKSFEPTSEELEAIVTEIKQKEQLNIT